MKSAAILAIMLWPVVCLSPVRADEPPCDRYHRVGITKVGYQIRKASEARSVPGDAIALLGNERFSLSSPFWTAPLVLSLQLKPDVLITWASAF